KDDPTDAELALDFLLKHPERLQPLNPQSPQMRALQQLVEMRRRLVDDQTRITNRITSALKNYFPQPLQWFADKDSQLFCDFLQQWPTLKAARQARRSTLERFFHEHNVRKAALISERIEAIKNARPLTEDDGVIRPFSLLVSVLAQQLRATLHAIKTFDAAALTIPRSFWVPPSTSSKGAKAKHDRQPCAPAATLNSPIRGRVKFPQLTAAGRCVFTRSERALQLERRPPS